MKKKILLFILPVFFVIGIIIYHSSYNKEDILNIKIDFEKILKSSSYSYLSKNVRGTNSITKEYYLTAGDTNNSSSIPVADVSKIYSYVRTGLDLFS